MGIRLFVTGLVVGGVLPTFAILVYVASGLLGCNAPGGGGCFVLGHNVDPILMLGKTALVNSIITVAIGLLLCSLGLGTMTFSLIARQFGQRKPPDIVQIQPTSGAESSEPEESTPQALRKRPSLIRQIFEWFLGAGAIAIFVAAAQIPSGARVWRYAAIVGAVISLVVLITHRRYAAVLLLASGMFFFTSCTANFRWGGG